MAMIDHYYLEVLLFNIRAKIMYLSFRLLGKMAMVAWVAPAWKGLDPATGWEVTVTEWVDPDMVENGLNGSQRVVMVEENAAQQRRSGEA